MFVSSILGVSQTSDLLLIQKGSIQELNGCSRAFCFLECENARKFIVLLYQNHYRYIFTEHRSHRNCSSFLMMQYLHQAAFLILLNMIILHERLWTANASQCYGTFFPQQWLATAPRKDIHSNSVLQNRYYFGKKKITKQNKNNNQTTKQPTNEQTKQTPLIFNLLACPSFLPKKENFHMDLDY